MYRALTRHPSSSLFAQCGSVTRVGMGLAWECDSRGNMMRLCVRREREGFFQDGGRLVLIINHNYSLIGVFYRKIF